MNTAMFIGEVKELLSDPEHWTKREFARDEAGWSVNPSDDAAVCFCTAGAVQRVAYLHGMTLMPSVRTSFLFNDVTRCLGAAAVRENGDPWSSYLSFQDSDETTHAQLLEFLDRAIAIAESEIVPALV